MTTWSDFTEQLNGIFNMLQNTMEGNSEKIEAQQKLYSDLYVIFSKHSKKLATLANGLNEQVLAAAYAEESNLQHHQLLSNSLLRIADASRRVSLRLKSEILDPLKTFSQNYGNVSSDMQGRFKMRLESLGAIEAETMKNRQVYLQASEKFEKHREMQKKVIEKIESGSKSQLEKFNQTTKKLTETITSAEKFYIASIEKANYGLAEAKKQLTEIGQSLAYNEDSRRSFFRKTIINSIRTLEEFSSAYDPEPARKLQETKGEKRGEDSLLTIIKGQLERTLSVDYKEEFVSYQEILRNKKKKHEDEDFGNLQEYINKISEQDRRTITFLVNSLLMNKGNKKMSDQGIQEERPLAQNKRQGQNGENLSKEKQKIPSVLSSTGRNIMSEEQDSVKSRILQELPYSIYFVERLYRGVQDMSSFYLRVPEDGFNFLLNAFSTISNHLDSKDHLGSEFIYKMMMISTRIMLRKAGSQSPQLLCSAFGKSSPIFKQPNLLPSLLSHLHRRKTHRKKHEEKGPLQKAKGLLAAFSRSKAPALNEEQQYNCLQELVSLMAHFSVPNEIILPFLRESLGRAHQDAYDYLKGLILDKKDAEERQNIQVRKEIQQKKEQLLMSALQRKTLGLHAIQLAAEKGFFGLKDLNCRLICKQLINIHKYILSSLELPPSQKWIRLIPLRKNIDYISMKQEVAEESVPSGVEEIITLDVNRSLHLHGESLSPTVLHSLLRTYAHFHKDIGYCQGMNYLAGYLYIKLENEQSCYRVFQHLMETRFSEIFANEFEALKLKMYQFQRLLALFHPEISEHFKRHGIAPECYIVSWIITLFASSYQYTLNSYLIDQIWQKFIIWGWPQFFSFLLWLFATHKQQLLELSYDKALHFLGELPRSSLFLSDHKTLKQLYPDMEDVRAGVEAYPVSQELLDKFTNEYNLDQKDQK